MDQEQTKNQFCLNCVIIPCLCDLLRLEQKISALRRAADQAPKQAQGEEDVEAENKQAGRDSNKRLVGIRMICQEDCQKASQAGRQVPSRKEKRNHQDLGQELRDGAEGVHAVPGSPVLQAQVSRLIISKEVVQEEKEAWMHVPGRKGAGNLRDQEDFQDCQEASQAGRQVPSRK